MSEPTRPFYVTGGTLKPGEPSYVERRADTELFESLLAGEFCYVLTARQMGKSSLMARTATRLEQAGVCSAIVDLTQIGSERGAQAATQWYFGIANLIHRQLGITEPLRPWWQERTDLSPVQRLTDFFRELVLKHCPGRVVIFVDEIDSTIGLPFADDFFAALRACFNARAIEPDFERLTFVLLGVASPDQLIQDPARTPFNIGKRIDLTDFTPAEAHTLAPELHADPGEADRRLERILHWTGGHPYLSQALCRAVRERAADTGTAEAAVDPWVEELFLTSRAQREETNLKHARARLEKRGPEGRRLLQLYRRVRQGKPVPDQPTSPLFAQLKLAGVVKATDEGRLAVRNRVYEAVFTPEWAKSAMPADRGRQLAASTMAATLVGVVIWYATFQPRFQERAFQAAIEDDSYNVAHEAYMALHTNPFSRSRAAELMQQFWEQRALRYALAGKRDESLLSYIQALDFGDNGRLRSQVQNLVGTDYEKLKFTLRHTLPARVVALSPDGMSVATGFWSPDIVKLQDIRTGKLLTLIISYQGQIESVAVSPDGRTLAMGFSDATATLLNIPELRPLVPNLQHEGPISSIAFSPDGRTVATGSVDRTARLWDALTGKILTSPLRHKSSVTAVAFSGDRRRVVTGSVDRTARLWDALTGKSLAQPLRHENPVKAVAFSPDGQSVETVSLQSTRIWSTLTEDSLAPSVQHQEFVDPVALSPDGQSVATGFSDRTVRLWDARTGALLTPPLQHGNSVNGLTFSPDGRTLATESMNTVRLWNTRTGTLLAPPLRHRNFVNGVTFSSDGQTLATGSINTVQLWDARTGTPLAAPLQYESPLNLMVFSPDGQTLVTGTSGIRGIQEDVTARLWGARTGKPLALPLQQAELVGVVTFSPDGRTVATRSQSTVRLWDTRTGKSLAPPLQHEQPVQELVFSPDNLTLATGSADTIRLWGARTGKPLTSSRAIQGWIKTIAFNPSGKAIFVAADQWLNTYSWDGKKSVPLSSQLLHGFWKKSFRFPSDCERCLQVALRDSGNSFHLETLRLDEPTDPPIEGDPKELLEKWQSRLGLTFDEQMRPVPAVGLPGATAEAAGSGGVLRGNW